MFHVIDPRVFERPLLDELCALATRARLLAKTDAGARALRDLLPTRRAMLYFTQPSTRTFLSFNNACHILGMRTSEIRDPSTSSEVKGESFEDSIRTFSSYVDVIVMRTKESGRAAQAARLMNGIPRPVPVINAGSGSDQHPTQALLDIYTLQRSFEDIGGIDGKVIGMMGDLKRGRTVRSLCYLMKNYTNVRLVFIAPEQFAMEPDVKAYLDEHKHSRIPRPRGSKTRCPRSTRSTSRACRPNGIRPANRATSTCRASASARRSSRVSSATRSSCIRLPRGAEIDPTVDQDPRAMYWRQERNGMWMRVAVLIKIFAAEDRIAEIAS